MLVAAVDAVPSGAPGFRHDDSQHCVVTLSVLAVDVAYRGRGLGRRLVVAIEQAAIRLAASRVQLGAGPGERDFYRRLGYTCRSRMHKPLPAPLTAGRTAGPGPPAAT